MVYLKNSIYKLTDKEKINFKNALKNKAALILNERVETSLAAMNEAQSSANEEGKSSAGDKYETSRAMAQIDRDIHARQLESARKELTLVQNADVSVFHNRIGFGSYVEASNGKYFFLAGIGAVSFENQFIFFLSISSPVGKSFSGKATGEKVVFNGNEIIIENVF